MWSPVPPSIQAAREGATIIVNCSASDETIGKAAYRKSLIEGQSARLIAGYVYANAGGGGIYDRSCFWRAQYDSGERNDAGGRERFRNGAIYSEIDIQRVISERRKNTTFQTEKTRKLVRVPFQVEMTDTFLTREFPSRPFVPDSSEEREKRCEEILMIQAMG